MINDIIKKMRERDSKKNIRDIREKIKQLNIDEGISQNMSSHTKISYDVRLEKKRASHLRGDEQVHRLLNTYVKSYQKKLCITEEQGSLVP